MAIVIPPGLRRLAALALLILVAGCAGSFPPRFQETAAQVPPVPADRARIFFYRDYEPYEGAGRPYLSLNGERIGIAEPGGAIYRDVAPGTYRVTVASYGIWPFPPPPLALRAGEVRYVKIESLQSWASCGTIMRFTFVPMPVDAAQGEREVSGSWFYGGS